MTKSPDDPGHAFHRRADLREAGKVRDHVRIEADASERERLAAWLEIPAVRALAAELDLRRTAGDGVSIEGVVRLAATLTCTVTLEPFDADFEAQVSRRFAPQAAVIDSAQIDLDAAEDVVEPLPPGGLDLGAIAAEEASLMLPDHPRKPGAAFDVGSAGPARENPFAALAKLKGGDPA